MKQAQNRAQQDKPVAKMQSLKFTKEEELEIAKKNALEGLNDIVGIVRGVSLILRNGYEHFSENDWSLLAPGLAYALDSVNDTIDAYYFHRLGDTVEDNVRPAMLEYLLNQKLKSVRKQMAEERRTR